jgi:hypothetical protein
MTADQGSGADQLEVPGNEPFRGTKQDPATALCQDSLTLPFVELTAGGEQAHLRHLGQLFIREIKFDALGSGAAYLASTGYQHPSKPLLRILAGTRDQQVNKVIQIAAYDRIDTPV